MLRALAIAYDWLLCKLGVTGNFARLVFDQNDVSDLAIVVQRTSYCTTHAGVAYRLEDRALRILHFAAHVRLWEQRPPEATWTYIVPNLQFSEDVDFLTEFFALVYRANTKTLPYSFRFDPDLRFDRDTGVVTLNHGDGLTCSTFVVALFRSVGNPLVRVLTWPRSANQADVQARTFTLDQWKTSGRPELEMRAKEIEPTIRVMRISPEQVAGACLQDHLPTGFYRARANGQEILRRIDARSSC
jgi:hypothetical protein